MREIPVIPNSMPTVTTTVHHTVELPALCPVTGNPQKGSTLSIKYSPHSHLLDVFGIAGVIEDYINNTEVRDIEYMVQHLAQRIANRLGITAA